MFHVALSTALFLDLVFWSILWAQVGGNEEMPGFFSVLNVHAINSVLLLGEVFLGKLQMVPAQIVRLFYLEIACQLNQNLNPVFVDTHPHPRVTPSFCPIYYEMNLRAFRKGVQM